MISGNVGKDAETQQLKRELARVTMERDILKKSHKYFTKSAKAYTSALLALSVQICQSTIMDCTAFIHAIRTIEYLNNKKLRSFQ